MEDDKLPKPIAVEDAMIDSKGDNILHSLTFVKLFL